MNTTHTSRPKTLYALLFALLFISLGGFYGGLAFLLDSSGGLLGMSPEYLARAPVHTFTLPGLFLLVVMGMLPLLLAFALWKRPAWFHNHAVEARLHEEAAWSATLAFALFLLGWLGYQALLLGFSAPVQWVILATALIILGLALLPPIRRYYALA